VVAVTRLAPVLALVHVIASGARRAIESDT